MGTDGFQMYALLRESMKATLLDSYIKMKKTQASFKSASTLVGLVFPKQGLLGTLTVLLHLFFSCLIFTFFFFLVKQIISHTQRKTYLKCSNGRIKTSMQRKAGSSTRGS